jgi:hypothetical protein
MDDLVQKLTQALELIAVGDIRPESCKDFADATLVELGIWEDES